MPTPSSVAALLRHTPTVARLPNRAFISVSGSQASDFLNGIIATGVANPARPFYTTFLHAQGRVLYDVFVHTPPTSTSTSTNSQQSYLLEFDPSVPSHNPEVPPLVALLKRYVLRAKVRVREVTDEYDVWAAWGSNSKSAEERRSWIWARSGAGEPMWGSGVWPWGEGDAGWLQDRRAVGMGTRRVVRKGDRPQESTTHDEGSADDYLLHRIVHGVAEGAIDMPPLQAFPMESNLDLMGGLDFRKGCYVGQELTVRTYHTGVVRKRILPVLLQTPSSVGAPLFTGFSPPQTNIRASLTHVPAEGRVARPRGTGKLLSNTHGIGLALLRLEHVEGVDMGHLKLELPALEGEAGPIAVTPWKPDSWPVSDMLGEVEN